MICPPLVSLTIPMTRHSLLSSSSLSQTSHVFFHLLVGKNSAYREQSKCSIRYIWHKILRESRMKVFDNLEFGNASKLERFAKENILLTLCLLLQIHYVTYWCCRIVLLPIKTYLILVISIKMPRYSFPLQNHFNNSRWLEVKKIKLL